MKIYGLDARVVIRSPDNPYVGIKGLIVGYGKFAGEMAYKIRLNSGDLVYAACWEVSKISD